MAREKLNWKNATALNVTSKAGKGLEAKVRAAFEATKAAKVAFESYVNEHKPVPAGHRRAFLYRGGVKFLDVIGTTSAKASEESEDI